MPLQAHELAVVENRCTVLALTASFPQLFYIGSGAFPGGRKSRTKGAIAAVAASWRGPTVFDAYTT